MLTQEGGGVSPFAGSAMVKRACSHTVATGIGRRFQTPAIKNNNSKTKEDSPNRIPEYDSKGCHLGVFHACMAASEKDNVPYAASPA